MLLTVAAFADKNISKAMMVGENITIKPLSEGGGATTSNYNGSMTYTLSDGAAFTIVSTDEKVTNINGNCTYHNYTLTALKAGVYTFVVKISTKNSGSTASAVYITYTFTVKEDIKVNEITLDSNKQEIDKGDQVQLKATVGPEDAYNRVINWASSDETVATVSDAGLVTGIAPGACTVIATATDGSGANGYCTIIVKSVKGDINGDGIVNVADAVEVVNIILGK